MDFARFAWNFGKIMDSLSSSGATLVRNLIAAKDGGAVLALLPWAWFFYPKFGQPLAAIR